MLAKTPTRHTGRNGEWSRIEFSLDALDANIVRSLVLTGDKPEEANRWWAAFWNGHRFEAIKVGVEASYISGGKRYTSVFATWFPADGAEPFEERMDLYYPVDPRMLHDDVEGATSARPNADNTGWLFYPASDIDAMVDREGALRSAVVGYFAEAIEAAQIKVNEATNSVVRSGAVANHSTLCLLYTSPSPRDS